MRTETIAGRECRIGLIGYGRWGRVLLQNFRRLAPVPLVIDLRADALAPDLQREFPGLSVVSSLDRFLDDPELSVAVIASPSETHHDLVTATLRYPSGVIGMFQLSMSHPEKVRRLFAIGESAALRFDDLAQEKLTRWDNLHQDPLQAFDQRTGVVESGRPIPYAQKEPVLEECRHFLACVRDRFEPMGSGEVTVAARYFYMLGSNANPSTSRA